MEIILDYSVASKLLVSCALESKDNIIACCNNKNIRVWQFVGDFQLFREGAKSIATDDFIFEDAFDVYKDKINWLAATSGDYFSKGRVVEQPLVAATKKLGAGALIVSDNDEMIRKHENVVSLDAAWTLLNKEAVSIPFIDLKSQYQVMQGELEANMLKSIYAGQYIRGPECTTLEKNLSEYVGVKHCIGISSGTDALTVAMLALGVGQGDEVITTPFTYFACYETIKLIGATPVLVDIEADTYNIDAAKIAAKITDKTKAIMPVSLYGQCADMDAINTLANEHGIAVIEDAAQSFGATYKGKMSCGLSTIGCTSFFPSKPLGAYGDAGACFTNDDGLADKMRMIMNHGQTKKYTHVSLGTNARLDTVQAAIILVKLKYLRSEISARQKIAALYDDSLKIHAVVPNIRPQRTSAYAQYTLLVTERDKLMAALKAKGIPTAVHYPIPLHLQPALANDGYKLGDFPVAENISSKVVSLPMHPYLTPEKQEMIVDAVVHSLS